MTRKKLPEYYVQFRADELLYNNLNVFPGNTVTFHCKLLNDDSHSFRESLDKTLQAAVLIKSVRHPVAVWVMAALADGT
uniref:(California timema) hypothetical protein n=1 Tax=Timema californicum TaxID=61474 RepID=A0A7R9J1W4_TIMCA|nr:unnamed protein product [Timema californicum]